MMTIHESEARRLVSVALATGALLLGACTSAGSQPSNSLASKPQKGSPSAASLHPVQPADDSGEFCRSLIRAGMVNTTALEESGDPSTMLEALDSLVSTAPADIAADFSTFVRVEHSTLDPTTASAPVDLANQGTREALAHVATYLHDTCRLT